MRRIAAPLGLVAILLMGWFPFVRGNRVPLLGLVDLGFHELGHMLTSFVPGSFPVLAGSLTQVLVPAGLAVYFWRRGDRTAVALMLAWTGASMRDVSVYVADAPFQRLPLIGGIHDWAYLLNRWDMMNMADELAGLTAFVGFVTWVTGLVFVTWILVIGLRPERRKAPAGPVRRKRSFIEPPW